MGKVRTRAREFELLFLWNVKQFLRDARSLLQEYKHGVYLHFDLRLSQTHLKVNKINFHSFDV